MRHIIFGAGENAKKITRCLKQGEEILAYVDNNPDKQGKVFLEKIVISINEMLGYDYDFLVIASIYHDDITK